MDLYQTLAQYTPHWSPLEIRGIVIVLLTGMIAVGCLLCSRRIVLSQAVSGLCLLVVLLMIFGTTVFTRQSGPDALWKLRPFWSWRRVLAGDREMLMENLLNIALLLPVGILLPLTLRRPLRWWQGLLTGMLISFVIELCQLFWRRGLFELDDILHNSLGCMLGCIISSWCARRWKHWQ